MTRYADLKQLKQRHRTEKDITSPITGETYRIRKIDLIDFFTQGPLSIPLAEWAKGKEQDEIEQTITSATGQVLADNPDLIPAMNDMLLVAGVASHQVVIGPECGDDELLPDDLGDDKLLLVGEIMRFNGLFSNEQAERFRQSVVAIATRAGE